jgi:isochorismate synthase EntC
MIERISTLEDLIESNVEYFKKYDPKGEQKSENELLQSMNPIIHGAAKNTTHEHTPKVVINPNPIHKSDSDLDMQTYINNLAATRNNYQFAASEDAAANHSPTQLIE